MLENGALIFQKCLNECAKRILQRSVQHIVGYERREREQELILANRRVTVPSEMYTTLSMKCLDTTVFHMLGISMPERRKLSVSGTLFHIFNG